MYSFHIITVGPLKDAPNRELVAEYAKRISGTAKLRRTEIPAYKLPSEPSDGEVKAALRAEGRAIMRAVSKGAYVTALCVEGQRFDSPAFAERLRRAAESGAADVTFIIGSSYGLDDEVKNAADLRFSVSDLTFPHGLMQPILYEIIYRSLSIISGGKYHK